MNPLTTVRPIAQPLLETALPALAGALTTGVRHFSSGPSTPEVLNKASGTPVKHSGGGSRRSAEPASAEDTTPKKETSVGVEQAVEVMMLLSPLLLEAIPLITSLLRLQISNSRSGARGPESGVDSGHSARKSAEPPQPTKPTTARQVRLRREQAAEEARQAVLEKAESLVKQFAIIDKGVSAGLLFLVEEIREIDQLLTDAPNLAKEKGLTSFETREYIAELTHSKERAEWLAQTYAQYEHVPKADIPDDLTEKYAQVGKFERGDPRREFRTSGSGSESEVATPEPGTTEFTMIGDSYHPKNRALHYRPLDKLADKTVPNALAMLNNTKFKDMFDMVIIDNKGTCFFSSSSDDHVLLIVSPDGKYIFSSSPKNSPAVLGSYRGTSDSGSLDSLFNALKPGKTAHDGQKPGQLNLLNRSDANLAALSKLKIDFKMGVNKPFLDKVAHDHITGTRQFHTFTIPTTDVTDKRGGAGETGYGWEIGQLPSYGFAVHRLSGEPLLGSEIQEVLKAGGKVNWEKGRAYIDYVPEPKEGNSATSAAASTSDPSTTSETEADTSISATPADQRES